MRRRVTDACLFPSFLCSMQPDYFLTYQLWPLAPDLTREVAEILVHPVSLRDDVDLSPLFRFWDRVNAEDRAICERQARGVASSGYTPGRYLEIDRPRRAADHDLGLVVHVVAHQRPVLTGDLDVPGATRRGSGSGNRGQDVSSVEADGRGESVLGLPGLDPLHLATDVLRFHPGDQPQEVETMHPGV